MMMKSQLLLLHSHITRTLIPRRDTFCLSMLKTTSLRKQNDLRGRIRSFPEINLLHHISNPFNIISNLFPLFKKGLPRFFVDPSDGRSTRVKAIVTIKVTVGELEDFADHAILLELVSTELDPKTGLEKETIKGNAQTTSKDKQKKEVKYEYDLEVEEGFGEIGAVLVENEHHMEIYIETIELEGLLLNGNVKLYCNSWVAPKSADQEKRVFFTNKSYLPSQTPHGLRIWREKELEEIQGNGRGERKSGDRIYDYDVYNDLGYPDISDTLKRPVLGGKEHPYPRRCRTGRPRDTDGVSETRLSRSIGFYVPKDEVFSTVKELTFATNTLHNVLHSLVPVLKGAIENKEHGFLKFSDIDSLFSGSVGIPAVPEKDVQPRILKKNSVLRFDTPAMLAKDKFSWLRDEEFARQTLAGLNPYSIKLVTEWPLKSELDPKIYGSPEEVMNHELRSAITKDVVEAEIHGFMTLEEAVKEKKLFMLDYHDLLLPFVKKVRELKGKTLYGSRTLFFLTPDGTLRPLAIELIRPPLDGNPQWKQVFTPKQDAIGCWLWRLAKTHVLAHDSGYHQLVSHWLRTHCATEPYIIATNRQLSVIHPIYRLLHPHFRYTMEINALARELLISADGIIEIAFSPGKYSMELSSAAYEAQWRFDHEALPADLLSRFMCFLAMLQGLKCKSDIVPVLVDIFHFAMIPRGMAVEDPTSPHGLKLTIEDYPFANDGLILWEAIKQWVTDYVKHYYPSSALVESDKELQAWWTEIRTKGHADKKDEPWWPELKTSKDLIGILTTMIWVTSGHHSAVNFGQYAYAGYFPNRPAIARIKMPNEEPKDEEYWKLFLRDPETVLLQCYPSQIQATAVMVVLDVLSSHSPDEEYIGTEMAGAWEKNPTIKAAFERFRGKLKELEKKIDDRNADSNLKNRNGAGVLPYELLKPFSEAGVTGMGVPNSISI